MEDTEAAGILVAANQTHAYLAPLADFVAKTGFSLFLPWDDGLDYLREFALADLEMEEALDFGLPPRRKKVA